MLEDDKGREQRKTWKVTSVEENIGVYQFSNGSWFDQTRVWKVLPLDGWNLLDNDWRFDN